MDRDAFYGFLAEWIFGLAGEMPRPFVVGLSAPQGAGKTTLTGELCRRASQRGLRAVSLSIDDFYLTHEEQAELARSHPGNPYLQHRGYPGTHDIDLGTTTLSALKALGDRGRVAVPSYDKTAWNGEGDRRPETEWPVVTAPLDLVILEGWMLGFAPLDPEALGDPHLRDVNGTLSRYAAWTSLLDAFIWLEAEDPRFMLAWRVEAEERSKAEGNPGMTLNQVKAFAERFLPAYLAYRPALPPGDRPIPVLHLTIGRDRLPVRLPRDDGSASAAPMTTAAKSA